MSRGRKPVISRYLSRRAGGDRPADRLLAEGGPGQVFAARGRDLVSDQVQEEPRHDQYGS